MKNQNSRGHHIKRLETDQCLQETDIRIETFVKIDQVSTYYLAHHIQQPILELLILNFKLTQIVFDESEQ